MIEPIKITIVTPVLNQEAFIEECINSVLSQGINNLEYIIMDGGSTDGTLDIIKKYEKHLYLESKKDNGQTFAIIDGFNKATGNIFAWLNADDVYEPGTLKKVQSIFKENSELQLLYADYFVKYMNGGKIAKPRISFDFNICLYAFLMIPQPSSFWTRQLYFSVNGLNPLFQYSFDYDFFLRSTKKICNKEKGILHINDYWSTFRVHEKSKSVTQIKKFAEERKKIYAQFDERIKIKPLRKIRKIYELIRTIYRFHSEIGIIPTKKDKNKA